MVAGVICTLLFIVIPLACGVLVFNRKRGRDPVERAMLALATGASGITIWALVFAPLVGPTMEWNGCRLAPVLAMFKGVPQGYSLYQDPTSGVMSGWIYGPVSALLYLPAGVWSGPSNAIFTAIVINMACALGPMVWLHLRAARSTGAATLFVLVPICVFVWFCVSGDGLRRAVFMVSADGPALGLAACAIALLMDRRARGRWSIQFASAACAVLSCWSKQTMLPFLVVAPLYLVLADGRRMAVRHLIALLACAVGISGLFLLMFGRSNMWFHMVKLPLSPGWKDEATLGRFIVLWRGTSELLIDMMEPLALLILSCAAMALCRLTPMRSNWRAWMRDNPWLMLPAAALVLVPPAVLGFVKVGGDSNNFALASFFVAMSGTVLLVVFVERLDEARWSRLASFTRSAMCAMVVLKGVHMTITPRNLSEMTARMARPYDNAEQQAFEHLKTAPGVTYFPWTTLAALFAEGKLYHFEGGMSDRLTGSAEAQKLDAGVEQIVNHLPPRLAYIAYPTSAQSTLSLRLFPKATARMPDDPALSHFVVFTEPRRLPTTRPAAQGAPPRSSVSQMSEGGH